MNWVLKDEEDCDTRSRRGEGCFKQMKQHEQRQTDTALGGETSGSAQLVRCMVMDKRMKLQSWGKGGRAEQSFKDAMSVDFDW